MMKRMLSSVFALCVVAPVWAGPADGVVELEVLPGWRTDNGTHMAGLQLSLADGWKTYWCPVMAASLHVLHGTGLRI